MRKITLANILGLEANHTHEELRKFQTLNSLNIKEAYKQRDDDTLDECTARADELMYAVGFKAKLFTLAELQAITK